MTGSKRRLRLLGIVIVTFVTLGCAFAAEEREEDDSVSESQAEALAAFSATQKYNLRVINDYRAQMGLTPLRISAKLSAFAHAGSMQLASDHDPHGHFEDAGKNIFDAGFEGTAGENQGDPHGWPQMSLDPSANERLQIADIQKAMFDEGPGEGHAHGHYRNMVNPKFRRVGIGLVTICGELYLTNDFSE